MKNQQAIQLYLVKNKGGKTPKFNDNFWVTVEVIMELLESFYIITQELSFRRECCSKIIPSCIALMNDIEVKLNMKSKKTAKSVKAKKFCSALKTNMEEYFERYIKDETLNVATLLDPR